MLSKENNEEEENGRYSCLKYSGEDIAQISEMTETTDEAQDVALKISKDEAQERLIWLANWFLSGVVSCELWKTEVISKINAPDKRRDFFAVPIPVILLSSA